MGLLGQVQSNLNSAANKIANPFSASVDSPFDGNDFSEGMTIREILSSGESGDVVVLIGNMMPKDKFPFGGTQRMKKEYYSGFPEPTMQVFGPEETDVTINGEFKDKKYQNKALKGVALEISNQLDAIRTRGNIVEVTLGLWKRYAILSQTKFDLRMITKIEYSLTFSIIGFSKPTNAIFIQGNKEYPFAINKDLIAAAADFESTRNSIPASVPLSIADQIDSLTSDVATVMATVTGFVDSIVNTVQDVRGSVSRVKGLIKYAQNKVRNYQSQVKGFNAFDPQQSLTGRYGNAAYYAKILAQSTVLVSLLQRLRTQFLNIVSDLPLARHLVREGETLQNISVKFYGVSDNWKRIYDYNNLTSTNLVTGSLLQIPRIT